MGCVGNTVSTERPKVGRPLLKAMVLSLVWTRRTSLRTWKGSAWMDLNQIGFDQSTKGTPSTAQQEADDETEDWSKRWGKDPNGTTAMAERHGRGTAEDGR